MYHSLRSIGLAKLWGCQAIIVLLIKLISFANLSSSVLLRTVDGGWMLLELLFESIWKIMSREWKREEINIKEEIFYAEKQESQ